MDLRVLLIAAGGGHTGHAVAIAQHLIDRGIDVAFIIVKDDIWSKLRVKPYGEIVAEIPQLLAPGESPVNVLKKIDIPIKALFYIPKGYDIVISTGGNHSVVTAIAAWIKGTSIFHVEVTERLATLSASTRILAPFSRLLVTQWPEQKELLPLRYLRKTMLTGPIYEKPRYKPKDEGYILVTAGTQGYKELFDAIYRAGIENVVLQTGKVNPTPYYKPGWRVFRFDPDLHRWIAGASIVVSHFGRTVIDAALTYRKPVVIVPNPRWSLTRGARFEDAILLARRLGVAIMSPSILHDVERLRRLLDVAYFMKPKQYPNGGGILVDILTKIYK